MKKRFCTHNEDEETLNFDVTDHAYEAKYTTEKIVRFNNGRLRIPDKLIGNGLE